MIVESDGRHNEGRLFVIIFVIEFDRGAPVLLQLLWHQPVQEIPDQVPHTCFSSGAFENGVYLLKILTRFLLYSSFDHRTSQDSQNMPWKRREKMASARNMIALNVVQASKSRLT